MKKIFASMITAGCVVSTGCMSTGGSNLKTSEESKQYLKSVQSQVLDPTTKNRKMSCKVQSEIKEKDWRKVVGWANNCVQLGKFRQVERYGNHLAKNHHMGPWGAYFLSLSAENRGELDRAMWMIELALKKTPNEGLLMYQKARLTWQAEEFENAVTLFEKALKQRSDLLGARMILGQLYYRDQEFEKAKKHFSKAVELDSSRTAAWVGMAECEVEDGNGEAALVALEKAIDLEPKNIDFRMREALIYEKVLKDNMQALTAYKRIKKMERRLVLNPSVSRQVAEKIKTLKTQIAKETPGAQVSKRQPANQEGVSK